MEVPMSMCNNPQVFVCVFLRHDEVVVQYGSDSYSIYTPSYIMMLVFVTNCYNFLHFNLFYINFAHGFKRIVLLFLK